ncbi:PQQ-dependent dehydrogenase, methanol/ethanol family [uncultured Imperialibacter sp.]|uniref:PQQ-dependent dehydrogenase, methanol/ethanol family n=1 Tax=uncultured Imperialibacter sp. TaxID=1672639 RepID=UPI0030D85B63|tara:strand:+ start:24216 stop:26348 length:2133 start_codon:yes stop_codon:yes gene_type:complete
MKLSFSSWRSSVAASILLITIIFCQCSQKAEPGSEAHIRNVTSAIDDKYLTKADASPGNWVTYGKNYAEDRFSPLNQINKKNVGRLGLAWSLNLGTTRGIEATPLVVDGVMFLTGPWSVVYAVDVRTGKKIWTYDPEVPRSTGKKGCCDVVNRGLAMYKGSLFVGTFDGRLISLDAATGKPLWEKLTVDTTKYYTITGAPRVVKGKVIIGNGGAEYGVRGYITAYDALTGEQAWRFYTVPGDPSKPFESKAMEIAAKTWSGEWWKYGGGGTAWEAMAFDPELNLFYLGTGNGSPWDWFHRSNGEGDNLFLSSIVAINPDNGEYVWHYQTTPGDTWDYTATQQLILADLEIEGQNRKVVMQAPKNGFFYVLDRITGELLSAEPYTYMNWATHVDKTTGRPVETDFSRYKEKNTVISPGPNGGHNWHPMAYNATTGLVYIPAHINNHFYGHDSNGATGTKLISTFVDGLDIRFDPSSPENMHTGHLLAWNPSTQKAAWVVKYEGTNPFQGPVNGGVVTTGGGLVFQGTGDGRLFAYDAADGTQLWEHELGGGAVAPPITYLVDGVQYVSIAVGWGGGPPALWNRFTDDIYPGTIFSFALDSIQSFQAKGVGRRTELIDLEVTATADQIKRGQQIYGANCLGCHGPMGTKGGSIPSLVYSAEGTFGIIEDIVLKGIFLPKGMPDFSGRLSAEDVSDIKNYLLSSAKVMKEQGN